jgi:hypothetical protein
MLAWRELFCAVLLARSVIAGFIPRHAVEGLRSKQVCLYYPLVCFRVPFALV